MKYRIFNKEDKVFLAEQDVEFLNLAVKTNGKVAGSTIYNANWGPVNPQLRDMDEIYTAQQSTGYIFKGVEVWEGDLFEREGAILKVGYCMENATYMFLAQQEYVGFLTALKAYEDIVSCIGNVLTHPDLWS